MTLLLAAPTILPVVLRLLNVEIPNELISPTTSPVIFPVTSPVRFPTKDVAVTIPAAFIFPIELIPTPFSPASTFPPT